MRLPVSSRDRRTRGSPSHTPGSCSHPPEIWRNIQGSLFIGGNTKLKSIPVHGLTLSIGYNKGDKVVTFWTGFNRGEGCRGSFLYGGYVLLNKMYLHSSCLDKEIEKRGQIVNTERRIKLLFSKKLFWFYGSPNVFSPFFICF